MKIKGFGLKCFGLILLTVSISLAGTENIGAQTNEQIEMAKALARQKGYTDDEINSFINHGKSDVNTSGSTSISQGVDRNESSSVSYGQMQKDTTQGRLFGESSRFPTGDPLSRIEKSDIYGHNIFSATGLSFIPSYNIPTPQNYVLSAGDQIIIDVWGAVVTNITATISPEGSVDIPNLGPVYLTGQTIKEAQKNIKQYLSKIYSGISQPTPNTFVKLSLGKIRSITINIVGDVKKPGTYTVPSLSTIASAMYLAGGPTSLGTVRSIRLYRQSKLISTLDIYDFIINGKFDSNVRLEDNDVIKVGPFLKLVKIRGAVKRSMRYEMKGEETLSDLLDYSGGFSDRALTSRIHVDRVGNQAGNVKAKIRKDGITEGAVARSFEISRPEFDKFALEDGDVVTVDTSSSLRFKNRVHIGGAVWYPGAYSLKKGSLETLSQLIYESGGLKEDAYLRRGYIKRLDRKRNRTAVSFDLQKVLLGAEDVNLMPDDHVIIKSRNDLKPITTFNVVGEVNSPNTFIFRDGYTLGDAIIMAGGVDERATMAKISVSRRRVPDPDFKYDERPSDSTAIIFAFNLLQHPDGANFKLEPFDIVNVYKSAAYEEQKSFSVHGEVLYPGSYVVNKKNARLSDLVKRAGGFTKYAFVAGARLNRNMTGDEVERMKKAVDAAKNLSRNDSVAVKNIEEKNKSYSIGINLKEAMANPGSDYDVMLKDGDVLSVPLLNNTVKISGNGVLYPNVVAYKKGARLNYYLSNAGGLLPKAAKRKIYAVYMNGTVASRRSADFKMMPGMEIVVPMKKEKSSSHDALSTVVTMASASASVATMIYAISRL
ncbi:MAG: SLBB domain-containing protein [Bacteroidales bacterium]|jgi:protein involved in polysaccharide export with SLBB domain|nr:SLBB domain-containing protein [Bacteroidales bacterium]